MTSTYTSAIAKVASVVAGASLVTLSFAALPASAQTTPTTDQLEVQIAALQAQIATLETQLGAGAQTSAVFMRDLTIGATGSDVVALQSWLIGRGYSIPAGATGYFGSQTQAAVAAYQAANGITPVAGYFGPITRASIVAAMGVTSTLPAGCTSTAGYSATTGVPCSSTTSSTGVLHGGSGYLTDISTQGDIESDLNEGDGDTKVVGFSAQAVGSDMEITRADVVFDLSGSSGSTNLNHYIQSASLYLNGQKLETLNATNGDYSSKTWTLRFSDLTGVIPEGSTGTLYVEVTPVTGINSSDMDQNVIATIPAQGIRAIDAQNVSDTYPASPISQTFDVSTAATGDLVVTAASDNPNASVVKGDTNNTTTGITVASFNLKANDQDVTIRTLPVELSESGTTNVGDIVQNVALMQGGNTLSTKTIATTGSPVTVDFSNLNLTIPEGSTESFQVVVTARRMGTGSSGTAFDVGDSLTATIGSSADWDVSDVNGDEVTPSGTATGGTVTFLTTGISTALVSATTSKYTGTNSGQADSTQYAITFTVTAGDTDLYIDRDVQNTLNPSAAGGGIAWATTTSSTAGVTGAAAANFSANDSNAADTATSYKVPAGTTRTFTVNVTLTATGTGFTGIELTGINWDTQSDTSASTNYYTANLDTFRTQDVSMMVH